jgi:hypothetical protein
MRAGKNPHPWRQKHLRPFADGHKVEYQNDIASGQHTVTVGPNH